MLDDPSLWLFAFAWFLAGFVNGISGMGAAMVALPIVAGSMNPAILVPATTVCVTIISASTAWVFWRHTRWHALKALLVGAVPGAAAGLGILLILPTSVLQLAAGVIMILFVAWQFNHSQGKAHGDTVPAGLTAGFFAGFVNTSISFGNPPVAIYSLYAGWNQLETLGSMNVYTFFVCLITMAAHASAGLYTMDVFEHALFGGPATILGMMAALPIAKHISQAVFRRILLLVIAAAGVVCLVRGLLAL
ncbi:hypothetical protein B5F76_01305 [Desulfovibrio sp. An276]|mgnify:CR=1 FL=1|uniref:sulfite exporter TauE/SafE family protein n=1 Tax=Desulfovibrio sp. An276 TaxID=1965618 RepID=UPI000B36C207|nr:sulfite exporter TauE/SafE family protein [Desulfovibrio sp. An276]OUO55275.1 hypothetical protein B5F76_01305 [Desulfovibrio sp. An276]